VRLTTNATIASGKLAKEMPSGVLSQRSSGSKAGTQTLRPKRSNDTDTQPVEPPHPALRRIGSDPSTKADTHTD
jgi:hypothetical protein